MPQDRNVLPSGAHVSIGGLDFFLDKNAPIEIQLPAYRRRSRSLFSGRTDISGLPGMQNIEPDLLQWAITNFSGEGQTILDPADPDSFKRFYRSEGLNFRTPGQVSLNRSTLLQAPPDSSGGSTGTKEGGADFGDDIGTSSVVGTDRRITLVGDIVKTSANHTPGASQVVADFYLFKEAQTLTTIQGSAFSLFSGDGVVSGSDFLLKNQQAACRKAFTAAFSGDYTAIAYWAPLYPAIGRPRAPTVAVTVIDNTSGGTVAQADSTFETTIVNWTAVSGHEYSIRVRITDMGTAKLVNLDRVDHGAQDSPTQVAVSVYNQSDSVVTATQTLQITNTTTAKVATLTYTGVIGKNYRYRVTGGAGAQRPFVDKVIHTVQTTTSGWQLDALRLGKGKNVWLTGSHAGSDIHTWYYDFTNEAFVSGPDLNATATSGETTVALAHSDASEYALTSGGTIARFDESSDAVYATSFDSASGMTVCQGRLFVLCQTSTAVTIYTLGLDTGTYAGEGTAVANATVALAPTQTDNTIRQRMCAAPTGARFFVNYAVDCVVYEADSSGASLVSQEIARLAPGSKGWSIEHVGGLTFVGAQATTEADETPVSTLWEIDANGVPRTVFNFREVGGSEAPIIAMQAYQQDLWLLQGEYIWRYSLASGGLFCEYQLSPHDSEQARGIAVLQVHQFATYAVEQSTSGAVWVSGSVATYRQASVVDGNTYTSSVYNFGLPGVEKLLTTIDVLTDDLPANVSVLVEYQKDQDGTWTAAGTVSSGASTKLHIDATYVTFQSLQIRVTLTSGTGVNTPTLKGIVVSALPVAAEEFFDLVLDMEDPNSYYHFTNEQTTAGEKALQLWALKTQRVPVTFVDGYGINDPRSNPEYLVVIEDIDQSADDVGEGRLTVHLRVL